MIVMKKLFLLLALLHTGNCALWSASIQPSKIPSTPVSPHLAALLDGSDSSSDDEDDFLTTGTRTAVDRTAFRSQLDAILAEGSPSTSPTNSPKQSAPSVQPTPLIRTGTARLRGITDTDIAATSSTTSMSSGESTPTSTSPARIKPPLPSLAKKQGLLEEAKIREVARAREAESRAKRVSIAPKKEELDALRYPFVEKHQAIFGAAVCSVNSATNGNYFVQHQKAFTKVQKAQKQAYRPLCLVTPYKDLQQRITIWKPSLHQAPLSNNNISDAAKNAHNIAMDTLVKELPRGSFIVDTIYIDEKPTVATYLNEQDKKELAESFDLARLEIVYETLSQAANTLQQPRPTTAQGTTKQKIQLGLPQEVIFDDMPILTTQHLMRNFDVVRNDGIVWMPKAVAATLETAPHPKAGKVKLSVKTPAKK